MPEKRSVRVFLTGASAGIGLAIARRLVGDGYEVWGASRDIGRLLKIEGFHPVQLDLRSLDSIAAGFAEASKESGGFDVLINNAGVGVFGETSAISAEVLEEQYQVLLHAPLALIRLILPEMKLRRSGRIVNVTSLAGDFPIPFMGAYSGAKAALSVQTACLRSELWEWGIRVTDVCPGDINTGFHGSTQRVGEQGPRCEAVWELQRREMEAAPGPEKVADCISAILKSTNPPPVVKVGGFAQVVLAPLIARMVPARWLDWGLRKYFGI